MEAKFQTIPETPVLGIEDTTGGAALILFAVAVFLCFGGMMLYLKRNSGDSSKTGE